MKYFKQSLLILFTCSAALISPLQAWVIILNGTSSTGKTTIARNLQKVEPCEILQFDCESNCLLIELVETMGYHYNSAMSVNDWIDSLPAEVRKKIEEIDDNLGWETVQKSIVKKAKKFMQQGTNVVIDTGLKSEDDYHLFLNNLRSNHTYFVLMYAPITQLLKNVVIRNHSGDNDEKRSPLGPLFQYFCLLAKKCEPASSEKLDILTKKDFNAVFKNIETMIKSGEKFDETWVKTDNFERLKSIVDHEFFHTCWSYTPDCMKDWLPWYLFKTWLPCYCTEQEKIGITLKLPIKHDLVINTGVANQDEATKILVDWLTDKVS